MESEDQKDSQEVASLFRDTLNSHGYGFHYSVLKRVQELRAEGKSSWVFEAAEVPVSVGAEDTRIDFILKRHPGPPFYLLAECKRSNPAISNWCFARAPYVHRNRYAAAEPLLLERLYPPANGRPSKSYCFPFRATAGTNPCHIAFDVKSKQKGDRHDSGRGAIEKAASQIMRGLNGFVNLLPDHPGMLKEQPTAFLPVIFTTAKLWLSDVDLASADLLSGEVDLTAAELRRVKWVAYHYHLTQGIKHSRWRGNEPEEIPALMDLDFIRTIFIVSADGVDEFLSWTNAIDVRG